MPKKTVIIDSESESEIVSKNEKKSRSFKTLIGQSNSLNACSSSAIEPMQVEELNLSSNGNNVQEGESLDPGFENSINDETSNSCESNSVGNEDRIILIKE